SLYLLERAGHIQRLAGSKGFGGPSGPAPWEANAGSAAVAPGAKPGRGPRTILMLDSVPAAQLKLTPGDVERRAAQERRKLREMIEFCYTEYCYRAHILDYFGDRNHARKCGTCGNCAPRTKAETPPATDDELNEVSTKATRGKVRSGGAVGAVPRALSDDELLRVRKILACA